MKLHYGCGVEVADGWWNCDASPRLYLQRLPVVGRVLARMVHPRFPAEINYGDVVKGLPIPEASCEAAYCSHVLEHLALEDCRTALRNTWRYLKPGGVFRMVLPDLESHIRYYNQSAEALAAIKFMSWTNLGHKRRPHGVKARIEEMFGNHAHLWMWDFKAMEAELVQAGFCNIRRCKFGDAADACFRAVENAARFEDALAVECFKPGTEAR